jgi:uncharacterized membrane protein YfhO
LKAPDFNPRRAALLETGEPLAGTGDPGEVKSIQHPNSNETVIGVQVVAPAYLFLAETWYPGWTVYVDGLERPLLRANYAFKAVKLEPGAHMVRFAFAPRSWTLGLFITAATLVVMVLLLLVSSRRRSPTA